MKKSLASHLLRKENCKEGIEGESTGGESCCLINEQEESPWSRRKQTRNTSHLFVAEGSNESDEENILASCFLLS